MNRDEVTQIFQRIQIETSPVGRQMLQGLLDYITRLESLMDSHNLWEELGEEEG